MNNQDGGLSSYEQVKNWIEANAMQEVISRSLPAGMNVGAWTASALAYIRMSKEMEKCDAMSILGSAIIVASFGLRLDGVMGHAYLRALPIKEGRRTIRHDAQVQLGYKGMVELAYRNPDVQDIEPVIVRQHDDFQFRKGTEPFLHHTWSTTEPRGERIAVYAGLRFKNGYYSFQIHSLDDVMELRKNILAQNWVRIEETKDGPVYFKKPYNEDWRKMTDREAHYLPWIGHIKPMILKTAIRWSQKFWPTVSTDFSYAANLVELDDAGISQGTAGYAKERMPREMLRGVKAIESVDKNKSTPRMSTPDGAELTEMMAAEAASRGGADPVNKKTKTTTDPPPKPTPPKDHFFKEGELPGKQTSKEPPQKEPPPKEPPPKDPKVMTDKDKALALELEKKEAADWAREQTES